LLRESVCFVLLLGRILFCVFCFCVLGLFCDDTLYIKITQQGKEFVGSKYKEGFAYEGAKVSMQIDDELIEDREWLCELVRITTEHLPVKKKK
jgi:TfoX/Sxy family transcriptional regulator of competence genes